MIKRNATLLLTALTCVGCKKFSEEKFNRNENCSQPFLESLMKNCSDTVKKWIKENEKLLCRLKVWQVQEIIEPCKNDVCLDGLKENYRTISGFKNEDFSGKSIFIKTLRDIRRNFDRNFEERKQKFDEEQSLDSQIKAKVGLKYDKVLWSDEYLEDVKDIFSQIKDKIIEIDFKFDPKRDELPSAMFEVIEVFKKFCEEVNNKDDFEQQSKELKNKIQLINGDLKGCLYEKLKTKMKNFNNRDLEDFLSASNEEVLFKQMYHVQDKEEISEEELRRIIRNINVSNLVNDSLYEKIQETLRFEIECIGSGKVRLKSKFDEIILTYKQCGISDDKVRTVEGIELIFPVKQDSVLIDLFRYISINKLVDSEGELNSIDKDKKAFPAKTSHGVDISKFIERCYKHCFD